MKPAQVLTGLLLAFLNVYRSKGFEYRLCFKDIKNGTCKYESFVGEWEFKRDEDCCNSDGAAYYVNVTEDNRIIFHVLKVGQRPCAPCKKAGRMTVNPPSCETTKCRYGKVCKIRYGRPKCLCPSCHTPDLKRHQPVCGTDGQTYNNECEFRRMTCKNGGLSNVEIDYEGSCQTGCDNVVCRKNLTCVVDVYNVPSCVSCEALYNSKSNFTRYDPICGADGVQYQNDDHLRLESCKQGKTIGVAYKGNCVANATCQKISCPKEDVQRDIRGNIYSVRRHCVYDNNNKPRCISCTCKESFPGSVKPSSELCGTDNMTYPSYCALKEKMCSGNTFLDIQYRGRCRDSDRINDDPAKQTLITTPKPCKYEELDNYYITQRELASVLKRHFGLEVRKKPLSDKKIIMERLIHFLQRKWSKITVKTDFSTPATKQPGRADTIEVVNLKRKASLGDFCKRTKRINETVNTKELVHTIVNEKFKTLYCYFPKVGCTQWKKVMVQLNPSESDVWVHDPRNFTFLADYSQNESEQMLKSYFKFLFVREPLERILSTYIDKFFNYDPAFYSSWRPDIALTRYMSGVETSYKSIITFEEFVNFVVRLHETDEFRNEHWQTSDKLCHPCGIDYDFIGGFENLEKEVCHVLEISGLKQADISLPGIKPSKTCLKIPFFLTHSSPSSY